MYLPVLGGLWRWDEESSTEDTPACHPFLPSIFQSQRPRGLKVQAFIL